MLQESPLYAYFPAHDLDRARRFWEGKLGFVPKSFDNAGVTYAFANGTAAFLLRVRERHCRLPVSNRQRRHIQGEPGLLVCRGRRPRDDGPEEARRGF